MGWQFRQGDGRPRHGEGGFAARHRPPPTGACSLQSSPDHSTPDAEPTPSPPGATTPDVNLGDPAPGAVAATGADPDRAPCATRSPEADLGRSALAGPGPDFGPQCDPSSGASVSRTRIFLGMIALLGGSALLLSLHPPRRGTDTPVTVVGSAGAETGQAAARHRPAPMRRPAPATETAAVSGTPTSAVGAPLASVAPAGMPTQRAPVAPVAPVAPSSTLETSAPGAPSASTRSSWKSVPAQSAAAASGMARSRTIARADYAAPAATRVLATAARVTAKRPLPARRERLAQRSANGHRTVAVAVGATPIASGTAERDVALLSVLLAHYRNRPLPNPASIEMEGAPSTIAVSAAGQHRTGARSAPCHGPGEARANACRARLCVNPRLGAACGRRHAK